MKKGQALVEFALIAPIFLPIIIFGFNVFFVYLQTTTLTRLAGQINSISTVTMCDSAYINYGLNEFDYLFVDKGKIDYFNTISRLQGNAFVIVCKGKGCACNYDDIVMTTVTYPINILFFQYELKLNAAGICVAGGE